MRFVLSLGYPTDYPRSGGPYAEKCNGCGFLYVFIDDGWGQQAEIKTADCAKLASLTFAGDEGCLVGGGGAGAFTPPGAAQPSANGKALFAWTPPFGRVVLMDKPSADSADSD